MVPLMTDRSEWHSPAAAMRTAISSGPGSRASTSSVTIGSVAVEDDGAHQLGHTIDCSSL